VQIKYPRKAAQQAAAHKMTTVSAYTWNLRTQAILMCPVVQLRNCFPP
jgi:hypothetical protein